MPNRREVRLGEIAEFQEGYVNPPQSKTQYFDGPIKWLRAVDLNNSFVFDTSRTLTNEGYRSAGRSAYLFPPNSLAISKSGTIGRLGIIKDWMCGNRAVINIRPKTEIVDTRYAFYALLSDKGQIDVLAEGSVQRNLYVSQLSTFLMPLPELSEQRQIAQLLGALDDKIDLNRRTNETLESMAHSIFKDWFVDFGPTRAKVEGREPYLAPELWDIFPEALNDEDKPVGWATISLKQLGKVVTGKTPSTKNPAFFGDDMPFQKIPDMRGRVYVLRTSTSLSEEGAKSQSQKTLPAGSVSVSCIATPGLVTLNHRDTQTNQQINTIIPSDRRQSHFVFWSCRRLAAAVMRGGSGGSVFRNMNKSSFENLQVVYPGKEVARTYSNTVAHIHDRMLLNEYESDSLAQTRDLLLPKLMSGEISLPEAEKAVEGVA